MNCTFSSFKSHLGIFPCKKKLDFAPLTRHETPSSASYQHSHTKRNIPKEKKKALWLSLSIVKALKRLLEGLSCKRQIIDIFFSCCKVVCFAAGIDFCVDWCGHTSIQFKEKTSCWGNNVVPHFWRKIHHRWPHKINDGDGQAFSYHFLYFPPPYMVHTLLTQIWSL